jgi:hypothetical protein
MVQFQTDDDERTTGTGQFDLSPSTDPIIDAPPHDGGFFRNHLTFLENYYAKASDGIQPVAWVLDDTVYTLSKSMSEYSPLRNETNAKLAQLAEEAWGLADASGRIPDFSGYDCFVIFHAGTGRDIDLASLLGFDPTPFDIPSIFLGPGAFKDAFGPDYPGIVVSGGQDTIGNSAIIPETENRLLPGISGDVLLELSFNGLLCASIASYLGLPDLFNTSTGYSGIGRFGLMDGQSIFSFAGLFPPEPSAWEKYWLGWDVPMTPPSGESVLSLPAVGLTSVDSLYRLPISQDEYFLVENRYRDPGKNGQQVTFVFDGATQTRTFSRDTVGFNAFDVSSLSGVVTDVEDLDWSLPGGIDEEGNLLNGGLIVWHIDEVVIQREIGTNSVNANADHRGVDVEEADGSQDIGQDYGFLSPGSGSEEGTPLDFWFKDNPAPVYENEFSGASFPSSTSNAGGNSHIALRNLTEASPNMAATVILGDDQVSLLQGFPKAIGEYLSDPSLTIGPVSTSGNEAIVVTSTGRDVPAQGLEGGEITAGLPGKLFGWTGTGIAAVQGSHADGHFVEGTNSQGVAFLETATALYDLNDDGIPEAIVGQGTTSFGRVGEQPAGSLKAFTQSDADNDSLADPFFSIDVSKRPTIPPVVGESMIAFGASDGWIYFVGFDGMLTDSARVIIAEGDSLAGVSRHPDGGFLVTTSGGRVELSTPGEVPVDPLGRNLGSPASGPAVMGIFGTGGVTPEPGGSNAPWFIAVATVDGTLHVFDTQWNSVPGFPVSTGGVCSTPPALGDLDGDGELDIVVFSENRVHAYHHNGASLDNFPATLGTSEPIASAPIMADVDGDLDIDIVAVAQNGLVTAFDKSGKMASGFPLQAGSGRQSAAAMRLSGPSLTTVDVALVVSSSSGSVTAWKAGSVPALNTGLFAWPQYQADAGKSGVAVLTGGGSPVSEQYFPADRVYNWPNPVYEGKTYLRYFVKEAAAVNIRIFDLAGDLVTELSGQAVGGLDNEIGWDVTGVQSGVYFARIEAVGASGSGSAVIKVAVVK